MPNENLSRATIPRGRERLDEVAAVLLAGIARMMEAERGGGRSRSKCSDLGESSLDFTADPSVCPNRQKTKGDAL